MHTLSFSLRSVPGSKSDTVLSASKQLQESVRCIKIDDVYEDKLYKLDYLLPEFTDKLPRLNSIKFKSEKCNFDLLIALVGRIKCDLLSKLSLDQIELGNWQQEEWTIVKFYPRIYLFNQNKQFAQVVRAKKIVLQFGANKAVHYSNKNFLVFNYLTYLKIIDVTLDANSKQLMDCFDNHLSKLVKLIKPDSSYMALLNKDIDFMTIRFKKNPSFPNPNWKCLRITFENCKEAPNLMNISKMLSLIENKTKVDAKFNILDRYSYGFNQSINGEMTNVLDKLFSLNIIRLSIKASGNYYFNNEQIISKIIDLKNLTEYDGNTVCGINLCMKNICSENYEDFKYLLSSQDFWSKNLNKTQRKFMKRLLESKQYSLLSQIQIREY